MPVFEGLLHELHNMIIIDLLFKLATWHGLAKLRLHIKSTIRYLESSTSRIGSLLRRFQSVTCEAYVTRELPSEEAARGHRKAAAAAKQHTGEKKGAEEVASTAAKSKMNLQKFNLTTYKAHSLGDYAKFICLYGTTDNYSTQLVRETL